jgi:hypothetical protein
MTGFRVKGTASGMAGPIFALVLAAVAACPDAAMADAGSFLRSIEGSWRGRGTAKIPGRRDVERVICQVENAFLAADSALEINGNCATTQSKSSVSGRITFSGDSVSGSLIGNLDGATITKSDGSYADDELVVSTNFLDNATGDLTRSRQVIRKTEAGFEAEFYTFDNRQGKFLITGSIRFSR